MDSYQTKQLYQVNMVVTIQEIRSRADPHTQSSGIVL